VAYLDTLELVSEGTLTREEIDAKIQEIGSAIRLKVDGTVHVLDHLDAQIHQANAQIARLQATVARCTRMKDALSFYALAELETAPGNELKGNLYTLARAKCPPSVNVLDARLLPERFLRIVPATSVPDKDAIKRAIQGSEEVPGAELLQRVRLRCK
jgi:hypothetical protein